MESWKNRVEIALQKVNAAGRNFISSLRPENQNPSVQTDFNYEALNYFRNRYQSENDVMDPCVDCSREFGILTIDGDEDDFFSSTLDYERRNDREEIRKKLAMDSDTEDYVADKLVQTKDNSSVDRIKGGSNLQICFVNEIANDHESSKEDINSSTLEQPKTWTASPRIKKAYNQSRPLSQNCEMIPSCSPTNNNSQPLVTKRQRPTFFFNRPRSWHVTKSEDRHDPDEDLFTRHRRLQAEAREALAQAKEMAKMQMEIERQKKKKSPIADIVGIQFPDSHNRLSRHALLDMNVAQLQVIVNDLHSQIETLNEDLVKLLLERDDLHMEQDSMLVDIEDFTRHLGLKGGGSVTYSSSSQLVVNPNTVTDDTMKAESVRRSQSAHLKKSKNLM